MRRTVIVQMWGGPRVMARLTFAPEEVDAMADATVTEHLRRLGVPVPAAEPERRARLKEWPTQTDLDSLATAHIAANGGVKPVARVLEQSSLPGRRLGAARSVPR